MMIRKVLIKLHDLHLINSYSFFLLFVCIYHKVPKFFDARKLCCNLPKIQTKKPNLKVCKWNSKQCRP